MLLFLAKIKKKYPILLIFEAKLTIILMKYKLLVLDLDGTLTNNKKK